MIEKKCKMKKEGCHGIFMARLNKQISCRNYNCIAYFRKQYFKKWKDSIPDYYERYIKKIPKRKYIDNNTPPDKEPEKKLSKYIRRPCNGVYCLGQERRILRGKRFCAKCAFYIRSYNGGYEE